MMWMLFVPVKRCIYVVFVMSMTTNDNHHIRKFQPETMISDFLTQQWEKQLYNIFENDFHIA